MSVSSKYGIILFDGVCNLCNHAVGLLIRWEGADRFRLFSFRKPFFGYFLGHPNLVFVFIV